MSLFKRLFRWLFPPRYYIYTRRKGWIHASKATEQDFKEMNGFMSECPIS